PNLIRSTNMNKPEFGFALAYVEDIAQARSWYVDTMGLEVEREAPNFIQFKSIGANFAIAPKEDLIDARKGTEVELWWLVDDVEAAYGELSKRAAVTTPMTEQPFGKFFGVTDPAGQPRFLLELAQGRPSQAL